MIFTQGGTKDGPQATETEIRCHYTPAQNFLRYQLITFRIES